MAALRRYQTISEDKVGEFDMVTFFKVPPPTKITSTLIKLPNKMDVPFYNTRSKYMGELPCHEETAKEYNFEKSIMQYSGALYLFTGSIELYEVTLHHILEDPTQESKYGYRLKMVIRTFAGDYWGTVWYDYLYYKKRDSQGNIVEKQNIVNPLRHNSLLTTIEEIVPSKYIIFVDYSPNGEEDATKKIAIGMELYHHDKNKFEELISEYEQSLQSLQNSRSGNFSNMFQYDNDDDDDNDDDNELARSNTQSDIDSEVSFNSDSD